MPVKSHYCNGGHLHVPGIGRDEDWEKYACPVCNRIHSMLQTLTLRIEGKDEYISCDHKSPPIYAERISKLKVELNAEL